MITGPKITRAGADQRPLCAFVVSASQAIGLGHVYRATSMAAELEKDGRVAFVCPTDSELAVRVLTAAGHTVYVQQNGQSLAEAVVVRRPLMVINDILDTHADYVDELKANGALVVSFEDRGPGASRSDLVFNALFMDDPPAPHFRHGPEYFCLRDEFGPTKSKHYSRMDDRVLVTFGGVDAADSTGRVVALLTEHEEFSRLHVTVITGPGYLHRTRLLSRLGRERRGAEVAWTQVTHRMAAHMAESSFAVTSAGRTVFELAAMRVPGIVLAANKKEEDHRFARLSGGFHYLGRHDKVNDDDLLEALKRMSSDAELRCTLRAQLESWNLGGGRERVLSEIRQLLSKAQDSQ